MSNQSPNQTKLIKLTAKIILAALGTVLYGILWALSNLTTQGKDYLKDFLTKRVEELSVEKDELQDIIDKERAAAEAAVEVKVEESVEDMDIFDSQPAEPEPTPIVEVVPTAVFKEQFTPTTAETVEWVTEDNVWLKATIDKPTVEVKDEPDTKLFVEPY